MKKIVLLLGSLIALGPIPSAAAGEKIETCKRALSKAWSIGLPPAAEIGLGISIGAIRLSASLAIDNAAENRFPYQWDQGHRITNKDQADASRAWFHIKTYFLTLIATEALRYSLAKKLREDKETPLPTKETENTDEKEKTKFEKIRSLVPSLSCITSTVIEVLRMNDMLDA